MAYSTRYKVNPYLATLGAGKGIAKAGQVLVNLGNDKIATSKADALKKEKTAKELALGNATNAKNRVLNPNAVEKMNKIYGIKNGSLLDMPGTPTKMNANLNLVDFGKQDKAKAKELKLLKEVAGKKLFKFYSDGSSEDTGLIAAKKTYKPTDPKTGIVRVNGLNYNTLYNPITRKMENTGQLAGNQDKSPQAKTPVLTTMARLIKEQKLFPKDSPEYEIYAKKIKSYSEGSADKNLALLTALGLGGNKTDSQTNPSPKKNIPVTDSDSLMKKYGL